MDRDTMYEETPQSEDHLSHIHADLAALSVNEKEQLAKEMGIQWLKKLSQCLAVSERWADNKSETFCKIVKIIYVIE